MVGADDGDGWVPPPPPPMAHTAGNRESAEPPSCTCPSAASVHSRGLAWMPVEHAHAVPQAVMKMGE